MKRRNVLYAQKADEDFAEIYDVVARGSSSARAIGYVERLKNFCDRLEIGSERGTLRDGVRPGLRVLGFERRVTIAFAVEEDRVMILRLFYGGRNWENLMEGSNVAP